MKKLSIFFIFTIFTSHSLVSNDSQTNNATQPLTNYAQQKKEKKTSVSLMSAIEGIASLSYYLVNFKFVGFSSITVIIGVLTHMWNSKASKEDQDKTNSKIEQANKKIENIQEQANKTEQKVNDVEIKIDSKVTDINDGMTKLRDSLGAIFLKIDKLHDNMNGIDKKLDQVTDFSSKTDEKVVSLGNASVEIKEILQIQKNDLQELKNEAVKSQNSLLNVSTNFNELKLVNENHGKRQEEIIKLMHEYGKKIDQSNENWAKNEEKLSRINDIAIETKKESEEIQRIAKSSDEKLSQSVNEHFEDIKKVFIGLQGKVDNLEQKLLTNNNPNN